MGLQQQYLQENIATALYAIYQNHQQKLTVSQPSGEELWWIACIAVDISPDIDRVMTLTASFTLCCKCDVEYDKHTSLGPNKQRSPWLQCSGQEAYDLALASRRLKLARDTTLHEQSADVTSQNRCMTR